MKPTQDHKQQDRRKAVAAYGVESYNERRWLGSDWLYKGLMYDRRSGYDRRKES